MDWRSCNFFLYDGDLTASEQKVVAQNFRNFLDVYRDHGLNTVSLTWAVPVDPSTGDILGDYTGMPNYFQSMPTKELLQKLTRIAHQEGFKVMWKPQFSTQEKDAGNVNAFYVNSDFDTDHFLAEVKAFWADLAPAAENVHTDLLILGTEQSEFAAPPFEAEWRAIIATVRSKFSGLLTYDELGYVQSGHVAADDITFWDALDFIGISMYLPLATDSTPSLSEAYFALYNNPIDFGGSEGPVNVPEVLEALSQQYGKPIIFTEAGTSSTAGVLQTPTNGSGILNYLEQSILYAVLADEFSKFSWFEGFNWWSSDTGWTAPPGTQEWKDFWSAFYNEGFSFIEKPAGDILLGLWGNGGFEDGPLSGKIILGNASANNLAGTAQDDLIAGEQGKDELRGLDGSDRLFGGNGADHVVGGANADLLFGGTSFEDMGDVVEGGGGPDKVFGGAGNDLVRGGVGDDLVNGGQDADRMFGGPGRDVFLFRELEGVDVIRDFSKADDTIWIDVDLCTSFAALLGFARNYSGGVAIDFGADVLKIEGLTKTQLDGSQFAFVDFHL